jgi:hypothetical protein
MITTEKDDIKFTVTDKLKARALEMLDDWHAMQFAEGLRLNNAAAVVFEREKRRLENKYGKDDQRTKDMVLRAEASAVAKSELFSRYTDAITPPVKPKEGWAIDGFVREPDGRGLEGLTVAAYDKQENRVKELGQATTDEKGYFSITVEKLPENPPRQVLMRAAKRKRLLPSTDVTVSPEPGGVERIEIIVRVTDTKPVDTKPVDTKPVDTKPVDTKPVDTKPVDTKPVDTQPVDTQPVDTKPIDTQPVDTKPVDNKPVQPRERPTVEPRPTVSVKLGATKESAAAKRGKSPAKKRSKRAGTKKRSK